MRRPATHLLPRKHGTRHETASASLLYRAQIFLPDNEGGHRIGGCGAGRCHHRRQHQARRRVQYRRRLSRLDLQRAAYVRALKQVTTLPETVRPRTRHARAERHP